ncbi:DUF3488 domain-containing protein [Nitratidesulfovibrio vulgaris]|uniref:Membrane protein, putative n=2 Tax=Nitratidesulfovibrio vulgaris TaxID=881 RepID=Q72WM1_NITV2|nr:DUF3488 domain-containing protein [Nitratidesulfovibrio vulgaris]AAS94387.1 membrane protein, putative [Nitratidesulfovibrio vulgaris str. Hildenborough]ADP88302.1 hypothetical protein Deval_3161 [Nitratidesulfovibrio vulgaris RCH1]
MPSRYAWKDAIGIILVIGTVFCLSYTIGANAWWYSKEAIHDDACTLGHSFTMGLDFDLDYMNEVSLGKYAKSYRGTPPVPPGIGVLSAPFVAFFSIFDRMAEHPVIQNHAQYFGSWAFFAVGLSSSFYFLMGAYLYYRGLRSLIDISPAFVFLLCTGTGILFYVLMRPLMAHAFEFFNYALCFFASVQLYREESRRQWLYALLAAIAVTLAWLTRLHAIFPVLFPPLALLGLMLTMQTFDRRTFLAKTAQYVLALVPCFAVAIALMYGIYAGPAPKLDSYGNIYSYVPVYTTFIAFVGDVIALVASRLALLPVILVGNSFPLWCFMPIAFFGVGALLFHGGTSARRHGQRTLWIAWTLLAVLYMAGPIAAVLLWRMPGSAYGFRYLYPLVPLGFLGFTLWRLRAGAQKSVVSRVVIAALLVTSIFGTLAPVAFNSNPAWGYTQSPINEFGLKEGVSARDNLYRTIAWMEHPSFLRVAIGYGPAFAFLPRTSPEVAGKQAFIHANTYAQVYIMCALWATVALAFAFHALRNKPAQHGARVSAISFIPVMVVFLSIWHICFVYYQHRPEVASKLLEHAASLRDTIEAERKEKGSYPVQQDFLPIETAENNVQFLYRSDGTNYKLIVLNAPDANVVTLFHPDERDPSRPWWAYGYWTKDARKW